ncbi:L-pipecolate oxidase [Cytospora mali]|uniref:L-pipecolate oxidase n=1 Tax=Cytospora mali TaxID=578113 RepID=A0A194UWP8_CYTMA|nr:L-pipecolate oxidase [Valsa mali var. pyri (nom. inval.)]
MSDPDHHPPSSSSPSSSSSLPNPLSSPTSFYPFTPTLKEQNKDINTTTTTTTTTTTIHHASAHNSPSSILVIGSGVFGLSTALSLARNPHFTNTKITIIDRSSPSPGTQQTLFPSRDASSIDTSRIIRADYADPAYAALASDAQEIWRRADGPGGDGRYQETGLMLVGDAAASAPLPKQPTSTAEKVEGGKKSGLDYTRLSWENVKALVAAGNRDSDKGKIQELPSPEAIREVYATGGGSGTWGYINRLSGWADAEACMDWLYREVQATNRVKFISGTVSSLLYSLYNKRTPEVRGVKLANTGEEITADLTVLATGAWTSSLINLTGRAVSTGQVLAYMDITDEEQAKLRNVPTLLNLSTGYFIITPSNNTLKVARHAYGYLNPSVSPNSNGSNNTLISMPVTHITDPSLEIPESDKVGLREALREMIPWPSLRDRAFKSTRLCWYTDTPDGDFIIDYHPDYKGLFLATGGSGHGFKFLPVIGDKITDCIVGQCPGAFKGKWSFRKEGLPAATSWDKVVTEDGSRGGLPGLTLREEMDKLQGKSGSRETSRL